ncbi:type I polyketide synthase [Streptomyces europaeiscabiei]|uniref:Type I polyketide synthase n=1 Tax=Streptomyces europaeiscabiei TaxID=146819 RepID=A0AAJ2UIP0_9ACTN|nr:type I polyketide synthase [Streptomyces europaeiscabiei]MDX3128264.1 type I polyketide synthase [Streptomyces europaeiscabiei]
MTTQDTRDLDSAESPDLPDAIAVVGLACRFPGAPDADAFWANLVDGRESIGFRTPGELAALGVPADRLADPRFVPAGGVLDGIDEFDAEYFGITPRDAALMDPQHRLFLQCAVAALEDAGQQADREHGSVGVYASAGFNSYLTHHLLPHAAELADRADVQWLAAGDKDYLATQTSYRLGLTGPSMSVQTACSSALVAVHLASEALLSGECDVALAGAVSAGVAQGHGYVHTEGGILSADGHCRPFDEAATGTVFGSGVGAVVLKRLADAVADGDTVRAVLLGSAVNNDGARKVGFTAPGMDGQIRVISAAQAVAGVTPADVSYVEAHGTATALGDRIELAALARVFASAAGRQRVLGAVKSNVGHLDTCAGMAGLIKTVLCLQHRTLVPTAHFERPSPGLADSGFRVLTAAESWTGSDGERIAGVSSFGIGGTNAHLILQDPPPSARAGRPAAQSAGWELLPLSARTPEALERAVSRLDGALAAPAAPSLPDAAHTLQTGRSAHAWRTAVPVPSGCPVRLAAAPGRPVRAAEREPGVVLLYPGQGAGAPGLAAEPYAAEPAFRDGLDHALEALAPWTGAPLRALLLDPAHQDLFDRTEIAQPALFAVEYALTAWWTALGIRPVALAGHSVGEFAAACAAGVFTLRDAARLVTERGRLMGGMPNGAMLAVPLPEREVREYLDRAHTELGARGTVTPPLEIAAVNAPDRCVVAGEPGAVDHLTTLLAEREVTGRGLGVRHAFHTWHADPLLEEFTKLVAAVPAHTPAVPVVSALTGRPLTAQEARSPGYWVRQLRHTVRFRDALSALPQETVLIEAGPGQALSGFARRTLGADRLVLPSLHAPDRTPDSAAENGSGRPPARLSALARLWERGVAVDWSVLGERAGRRHVPLPTYPFEPARHWFTPAAGAASAAAPTSPAGSVDGWLHVPSWAPAAPPVPGAHSTPGTVLLLADETGLAERLAARLTRDGIEVHTVVSRPYAGSHPAAYAVDPADPRAFAALVGELAERGRIPDAVVSCWALDEPGLDRASLDEVERGALRALTVPAELAQALSEAFPGRPVRMLLVTDAAHGVHGLRPRTPHAATAMGSVRALPGELPGFTLGALDLDCAPHDAPALERAAEAVAAELRAAGPISPLTAVRGRTRLVPVLDRPALTDADADPEQRAAAEPRAGGSWLVTGGLGGIGLAVAGRLAQDGDRTLLLVTRRPVPDGVAWTVIRPTGADPAPDCPPELARALSELTARGAAVCLVQCDVTDEEALESALGRIRAAHGRITGVVHAAGLPGGGTMALRGREDTARVLAPKVRGTVLLHRLTAEDRPTVLLCSSVLAVTGAAGQADYSGANAFLDSFAHTSDSTVSIGWDRWSETGMAVRGALGPAPESGGDPLEHPLFESRRTGEDGWTALRLRTGSDTDWLSAEHRLSGEPVLPGTALLDLVVAAHHLVAGPGPVELDAVFTHPLRVPAGEPPLVTVRVRPADAGGLDWEVRSSASARPHGQGRIAPRGGSAPDRMDLDAVAAAGSVHRPAPRNGAGGPAGAAGLSTGPRWDCLTEIREADTEALLTLRLPDAFHRDLAAHPLHPALLDVATGAVAGRTGRHLPVAYRKMTVHRSLTDSLCARVFLRSGDPAAGDTLIADMTLTDPDGSPLVTVEGFVLRPVASGPARTADTGGIPTGAGQRAFDRILANQHLPHILVSPRIGGAPGSSAPAAHHAHEQSGPVDPGDPGGTAPFQGLDEVGRRIADVWSRMLGVPRIRATDSVFELGADSLTIVQITAELQRAGLAVAPSDLFAHPTPGGLAAHLRASAEGEAAFPAEAETAFPAGGAPGASEPVRPARADGAPSGTGPGAFPDADLSAEDLAQVMNLFGSGEDMK